MEEFEVFFRDLTEDCQKRLAEHLGLAVEDVEKETNWDVFPLWMLVEK